MQIGYSEDTLRTNVCKQFANIESEFDWMRYYFRHKELECVEDCIRNIEDSLRAISENIENLKGETL